MKRVLHLRFVTEFLLLVSAAQQASSQHSAAGKLPVWNASVHPSPLPCSLPRLAGKTLHLSAVNAGGAFCLSFSPPNRMRWYGSWMATSWSAWKTRTVTTWCRSVSSVCSLSPCSLSLMRLRDRWVLNQGVLNRDTDSHSLYSSTLLWTAR